ncbi:hypothetical protein EV382_1425 [Micromonospora violae]|uniref:NACHT domain-containing protein n=1 Tax=Micromonospora violae TaxID=1278207 RepID=A0A4Q7UFP6_9ACTN|nr:hypothetical protein [Micromonospora violae]RZT78243.1 hypothetical protein EV382_1425 [Micromonospora violae]
MAAAPLAQDEASLGTFDWKSSILTIVALPVAYFLLKRLRDFAKRNVTLVTDAAFWVGDRIVAESVATRMSLKRYCRIQLDKEHSRYLPVPGSRGVMLQTDLVYIPLQLESAERSRVANATDIWKSNVRRARIVGDPGSGKSSLAKQMFRQACRVLLTDARNPLPIFIDLRSLCPPDDKNETELADWTLEFLQKEIESVQGFDMGRLYRTSAEGKGRGLLVLLDGLDEVASERYTLVASCINFMSERLGELNHKSRIILTMRTQFHHQVKYMFDSTFPPTFYIQSFTPTEIYSFLNRWPFPAETDRSATVNRLFAELTDKPTLRDMCSNPLVLAMYVASDQSGELASSPDTRTRFYALVTEELLIARRSRQLGMAAKSALLQQRESLLGKLALENLLNKDQAANQISFARALHLTRLICGAETVETAADLLRQICTETGILTEERAGETLRFIHLTFCEFLAAKEAVEGRRDGLHEIIDAHQRFSTSIAAHIRTRLVEVIPFALGLAPRVQSEEVLSEIHRLDDASVSGRCFLETQAYDHPSWVDYVDSETKRLTLTHPDAWGDPWLRRLHLLSVVVADEGEWASLHNRTAAYPLQNLFSKLVRGHRERLDLIFSSYASFDPQAAFRLAGAYGIDFLKERPDIVVAHLADPPFFAAIMERIRRARPEDHDRLLMLLAEGALSSAYVAERLASEPADLVPGSIKPSAIPHKARWFTKVAHTYSIIDGGMLRLSLLTYALSLALKDLSPYAYSAFPRLSIIRLARPPASLFFARLLAVNSMARATTVCILMGLAIYLTFALELAMPWKAVALPVIGLSLLHFAQWPKMSARYYTAMLLQSDSIISSRTMSVRRNGWLAPGVLLSYLTMHRQTLATDRIVSLRHLRVTQRGDLSQAQFDDSPTELRTASSGVEGRTHRL